MDDKSIEFDLSKFYMFGFDFHCQKPSTVIVAKPTSIEENDILFHFNYSYHSLAECVKKENIVAIGDIENGTVYVKGWRHPFAILNQKLFDEYLASGAVELSSLSN